jgi:hypothetical protein
MNKKYQVFVSSTFRDLEEERAKVIEILLNKDCIPVGMEYFPAIGEDQMTQIKELIDECDYFILILGGKYGSIEPVSEKSYTQLEYEYAVEKGIPISAFYVADKNKLTVDKTESESKRAGKLSDFESLVKRKLCKDWTNADDLAGKVSTSLDSQIKRNPRCGWVRANKVSSDEANRKILELQAENKKLTEEINFLSSKSPAGNELYQQGKDIFSIHYELFDFVEGQQNDFIDRTWNDIFLSISTLLLKPVSEEGIKDTLQEALLPPCARIDPSDFQTILIQLMALKLIMTDVAKDYGVYTYWVLTPYGRSEMVKLKAIKR